MRQPINLPQVPVQTTAAGGVAGFGDDAAPTARPFQLLSAVRNMQRVNQRAATTRTGRAPFADVAAFELIPGTPLDGISTFYRSNGTRRLITKVRRTYVSFDPVTGNLQSFFTTLQAGRFETVTFNDLLVIADPGNFLMSFDGVVNNQIAGNPPRASYICTAYKSIFLTGIVGQPDLVYASDAGRIDVWPATLDPVTGQPAPRDSFAAPVNDKDGDQTTWIALYRTNVVIWKRHTVHELHGPEVGQPSSLWRFMAVGAPGTMNGRTVQEVDGTLFWLSDRGVVAWNGGRPEIVSDPVRNTLARINWNAIGTASAGVDTTTGLYMLSLPLDSATTPSHTLVFDTRDRTWWLWDGWQPRAWTTFRFTGEAEISVHADANGKLYSLGGTTDEGAAIPYEAVFGPTTAGNAFRDKLLRRAYFVVSMSVGATMEAAVATTDTGAFGTPITLTAAANITRLRQMVPFITGQPVQAYSPKFRLSGLGLITLHDIAIDFSERGV